MILTKAACSGEYEQLKYQRRQEAVLKCAVDQCEILLDKENDCLCPHKSSPPLLRNFHKYILQCSPAPICVSDPSWSYRLTSVVNSVSDGTVLCAYVSNEETSPRDLGRCLVKLFKTDTISQTKKQRSSSHEAVLISDWYPHTLEHRCSSISIDRQLKRLKKSLPAFSCIRLLR